MEMQKIVNLLNSSENKYLKFATEKWYAIDSETKGSYSHHNPIKFLTGSLESSLCDYSVAYALVTGDITATGSNANAKVAFKNCAPFKRCRTEVNENFVDEADLLIIPCLCTICLITVITILILQEVYGRSKEMK